MAGVRFDKRLKIVGRATVGKGAPGGEVRHEDSLSGAKDLDGFAHEMHSAHHHGGDFGAEFGGFAGEGQRVAYYVGELLNVAFGVVMSEDNGAFFFFEATDFVHKSFSGCAQAIIPVHIR